LRFGCPAIRAGGEITIATFSRLGFAVFAFGGLAQIFDFFGLELTGFAGFEIEDQRSISDTPDFFDVMAYLFEHFTEFAVTAFDQHDLVPRIVS
jgi:hypothetical protein